MDGPDVTREMLTVAVSKLPEVLSALWEAGKRFGTRKDLQKHSQRYFDRLQEDCSRMQILGMEQPVPLESIYTEVRLARRLSSREFKTIDELERDARRQLEERSMKGIIDAALTQLVQETPDSLRSGEPAQQVSDSASRAEPDVESGSAAVVAGTDVGERISHLFNGMQLDDDLELAIHERLPSEVNRLLEERARHELNRRIIDDFGHAISDVSPSVPAVDAVKDKQRVLVLGMPGAGKTTFLKHLALRNLAGREENARLPIFVFLREYAASGCGTLLDYIASTFADCGFKDATPFLESTLRGKQECLILLDGLDEISHAKQEDAVRQIAKLTKKFPRNQFIAACRTANYLGQLEGFSELEIVEFGVQQVASFANGWFGEKADLATHFLADLRRHAGLQELATTPLLLALLCIGYRRNQRFPDQRSLVYLGCLYALLMEWDSSRQIRRDQLVEHFDSESKKTLIAKVACDTFCEDELFFSETDIIRYLDLNAKALPIADGLGNLVLREFVEHHGLLVERAQGVYSFSHLTIQEFLTAFHLSRGQSQEVLGNLSAEFWSDVRWSEVVVFLGGLLSRADAFLISLRNTAKAGLADKGLTHFLYGHDLPEPAEEYSAREKTFGEPGAWRAWFRWKIFEYRLHKASYGARSVDSVAVLAQSCVSDLLMKILELRDPSSPSTAGSRPLNRALRETLEGAPPPQRKGLSEEDLEALYRYVRMTAAILDIVGSGARVAPTLKTELAIDLSHPSTTAWDVKVTAPHNRLGA